jgi:hypothetical protein
MRVGVMTRMVSDVRDRRNLDKSAYAGRAEYRHDVKLPLLRASAVSSIRSEDFDKSVYSAGS